MQRLPRLDARYAQAATPEFRPDRTVLLVPALPLFLSLLSLSHRLQK